MTNTITIQKKVLYLGGKVNTIASKDGSEINYVSVEILIKEDKCKVECSLKMKPEEFLARGFEEYESYIATLEINIADKVKIKILELKDI